MPGINDEDDSAPPITITPGFEQAHDRCQHLTEPPPGLLGEAACGSTCSTPW